MKKLFKSFLCLIVASVTLFSFTACKKPVSATTTDGSKTVHNGQDTNGGMTLVHDGYLYFINGTKDNDGTSATKNTRGAICRVKLGEDDKIDTDSYEIVVDNLVGFDKGSLSILGDYLYFTTPSDEINYKTTKLNNQTKFMRYDLVNKKSYELYTTKQNSSSETISYAYYVVGEELYLVVYESTNATITSIKVDTTVSEVYVINDVKSCVLSENYGKSLTEKADANSYVYYTKSPVNYEYPQSGNFVYKTLPNQDNSSLISNNKNVAKKTISLLSIRNGKLLYSAKSIDASEDIVYYEEITSNDSELTCSNIVSYTTYENVVFVENDDEEKSISVVAYDSDAEEIIVYEKTSKNSPEIAGTVVNKISLSSSSSDSNSLSFVGTVTLEEEVEKADDEEESKKDKVTYLVYIDSNVAYKIEIMRTRNGENREISKLNDPIKLSTSTISPASGVLVPEIIGNYMYAFAKEVKDEKEADNIYMFRFDLTITENSKDFGTMVAKVEE